MITMITMITLQKRPHCNKSIRQKRENEQYSTNIHIITLLQCPQEPYKTSYNVPPHCNNVISNRYTRQYKGKKGE